MSTPFASFPFDASGVDPFAHPLFIMWNRAPTTNDFYNPGTEIQDNSVNPPVIYQTSGYGIWNVGGGEQATTSRYGTVILTDNNQPVATKVYADALAIAGAPVSTEIVAGIGQIATNAEAVAGTASTPALALLLTPSNLSPVFAAPPAIGGTIPAAGTFAALVGTTGNFSGLLTASASATITTGATDLNLASDASTGAVNIGTGAGARTITLGNITGATALNLTAGSGAVNCATDFNLTSVATKISMNGGAATDFIGRATLVAGTVTVNNTNIAAGDRIFVTRSALNASPALGFPITTISAGVSFTIASFSAAGAAAVTDVSTFDYVIVRQT